MSVCKSRVGPVRPTTSSLARTRTPGSKRCALSPVVGICLANKGQLPLALEGVSTRRPLPTLSNLGTKGTRHNRCSMRFDYRQGKEARALIFPVVARRANPNFDSMK